MRCAFFFGHRGIVGPCWCGPICYPKVVFIFDFGNPSKGKTSSEQYLNLTGFQVACGHLLFRAHLAGESGLPFHGDLLSQAFWKFIGCRLLLPWMQAIPSQLNMLLEARYTFEGCFKGNQRNAISTCTHIDG